MKLLTIIFLVLALSAVGQNPMRQELTQPNLSQQNHTQHELAALEQWRAGDSVSEQSVKQFGENSAFRAEPISDAIFSRMKGRSYKDNCTVPLDSLRYLKVLHYDADGQIRLGELVCHRSISRDLIDIFRELYKACYPIERMVLIDEYEADDELSMRANNSSAFNFRFAAGSTKVLSSHSKGMAIDINPLYNPYVKVRDGYTIVQPSTARQYVDRSADFRYKIVAGDLCHRLFLEHGFEWGGAWRSLKDYQHFEKK